MYRRIKGTINMQHLFTPAFNIHYDHIRDIVKISPDMLWVLHNFARRSQHMAEIGVAKGGSAYIMQQASPDAQLYLFDTFCGMPANTHNLPEGMFPSSIGEVVKLLPQCYTVTSKMEDCVESDFSRIPLLDLIHWNADLPEPLEATIKHLWPLLRKGCALIIDDYHTN